MGKRKRKKEEVVGSPPPPVPTVRLKRSTYQPTKAELEEEIHIPTTPEKLAKALGRKVKIEFED
ncbi:MAG: hypothetical protein OXG98_16250 [Gemmatimonadetes bacterium]|nr:hypothetical protein [Gemmatimonadota bacterium]